MTVQWALQKETRTHNRGKENSWWSNFLCYSPFFAGIVHHVVHWIPRPYIFVFPRLPGRKGSEWEQVRHVRRRPLVGSGKYPGLMGQNDGSVLTGGHLQTLKVVFLETCSFSLIHVTSPTSWSKSSCETVGVKDHHITKEQVKSGTKAKQGLELETFCQHLFVSPSYFSDFCHMTI